MSCKSDKRPITISCVLLSWTENHARSSRLPVHRVWAISAFIWYFVIVIFYLRLWHRLARFERGDILVRIWWAIFELFKNQFIDFILMRIEFLDELEICDLVDVFELFILHLVNWLLVNQVSLNTKIVFRKSFTSLVAGILPKGFLFIRFKAVL